MPYHSITQGLKADQANMGKCLVDLDSLGLAKINIFHSPPFYAIEHNNPDVKEGGTWQPSNCESLQRVAIIVPYRDREQHLRILLNRLHPMLQKQRIHYRIFVIEQFGNDLFNRGKLMNVGFKEALKVGHFDCFIFHDTDLIPENDKNLYLCDQDARHLSSAIDEMRYHVMYYNYAGGVIAMNQKNFIKINGYSNMYWGWGNEDDDLSARTQEKGLLLTRPPEHIGRFKMVRHTKASRAEHGNELFLGWRGRWYHDGLNGMNYTVIKQTNLKLYTNVTVNLGPSDNHMIDPTKDTTRETLWWFLKFYYP
ncbi:beta-1,4-galactosyltransferase 3-like [Liolophura sinensis]|uniref:beta-1,4-galactosyltransferase 3-like n=1 Tax=Liolophura sinensis TaxID=3198878 RepID=UPI003158A6DB